MSITTAIAAVVAFRAARPLSVARDVAMAEAILCGHRTEHDLSALGFFNDEIHSHYRAALALADRGGADITKESRHV